jgi:hypothetical protein
MPPPITATAQIMCSFGTGPGVFQALPLTRVLIEGKPAATIQDNVMGVNILPFPTCLSPMNPSGMGKVPVPTPGPCVPQMVSPWIPVSPTKLIGGKPALIGGSTCVCSFGGIVQMTTPAAFKTQIS